MHAHASQLLPDPLLILLNPAPTQTHTHQTIIPRSHHDALLQSGKQPLSLQESSDRERCQWCRLVTARVLAYAPYLTTAYVAFVLTLHLLGLPPPGDGDAHLLRPHRPSALHMAPQALHLHFGEPYNSKAAIWHEGMGVTVFKWRTRLTCVDYVHLHPDPVH